MRRPRQTGDGIGGQDSFLDIVANLVGILIILVVIASLYAKTERQQVAEDQELVQQLQEKQAKLDQTKSYVAKMTLDNHQKEADIRNEKRLTKNLADERHAKLMQLEQIKKVIDDKTKDWTSQERETLKRKATIDSLKEQLASVKSQIDSWEIEKESLVEMIEHFPTPIAKTVFTDEIHFCIKEGRISFVPLEELVDRMKSQWKVVAEKLEYSNQTVQSVGPMDGYRLQYELVKEQVARDGLPTTIIRFDHFTVEPVFSDIGEPINAQFFEQESDFIRRIANRNPERTTISLWVYSDSFAEFMELKRRLHARGFQIASWPLAEGRPISGGPNGLKTSAQ